MALGVHQKIIADDINFVCDNVAAKGCLVSFTANDGHVKKSNDVADKVAGLLLIDVVAGIHPSNINLNEETGTINQSRNFQKLQTHVSGVVRLLKIGECVTNAVSGTINCGDVLKNAAGGTLRVGGGGQTVGHALSDKDSDGYVKVWINIV